ncbi:MAG: site-2 protease family protein [Chloroflexi bacterium]|nr:site-2 protease family protein [Chloroflexota bacterium]
MGMSIRLGKVWGIPLGINYTWFVVLLLVIFSLASQFRSVFPEWAAYQHWGLAIVTSLLFFASVLLHELAHSLVAVRKGIPVHSITLFVFGGVSHISREANRPGLEFVIAVVGPLSSLVLGLLFWGIAMAGRTTSEHLWAAGLTLAQANFILGIFNLVPGFPLDGGRVLRALLWGATRNYDRATQVASITGRIVAVLFILAGVFIALQVNLISGIWLVVIGWFLESAAASSYRQFRLREGLRGYTARDLMTTERPTVPPSLSIRQLVEERILPTGRRCFVVGEGEATYGLVTVHSAREVPRHRWDLVPVREVMIPLEGLKAVTPQEDAFRVLELMDEANVNQVPVVQDRRIIGLITRENVLHFLRTREELGI